MKDADFKSPWKRIVPGKYEKAEDGACKLKTQRHEQDGFYEPDHAFGGFHIHGFPYEQAAFDADSFSGGQDEADAHRGDAETAYLD